MREHARVAYELVAGEAKNLPDILKRGEADFVILDKPLHQAAVTSHHLGDEIYVVIESARHASPDNIYLDLDPDDRVTGEYFRLTRKTPVYRRSYMSEVYGIIDGVAEGMGRAVVSRHLLAGRDDVREVDEFPPVPSGVHLHYYSQPFYSRLQRAVRTLLINEFPRRLEIT
jgi:DNA-binding transcriptional LysR family regulator